MHSYPISTSAGMVRSWFGWIHWEQEQSCLFLFIFTHLWFHMWAPKTQLSLCFLTIIHLHNLLGMNKHSDADTRKYLTAFHLSVRQDAFFIDAKSHRHDWFDFLRFLSKQVQGMNAISQVADHCKLRSLDGSGQKANIKGLPSNQLDCLAHSSLAASSLQTSGKIFTKQPPPRRRTLLYLQKFIHKLNTYVARW